MLVVPANKLVDFQEVRFELGFKQLRMVTEFELGKLFPDSELGAMPPVGALYGLPVYLDEAMADERLIAFNGGHASRRHPHADRGIPPAGSTAVVP